MLPSSTLRAVNSLTIAICLFQCGSCPLQMCAQASVPARAAGPALNPSLQTHGSDSGVGVGLARGWMRTPTHHSCESSPPGIFFVLFSRSSHQLVFCWPALVSTCTLTVDALCTVQ